MVKNNSELHRVSECAVFARSRLAIIFFFAFGGIVLATPLVSALFHHKFNRGASVRPQLDSAKHTKGSARVHQRS